MAGAQEVYGLVDDMVLVGLEMIHPALLDQLDHPARVQVHAETDAPAEVGQVLDGQPQAPGATGTQHQPVRASGKILVRKSLGKKLVVDAKIFDVDPALGNAGGATGFEDVDRTVVHGLGNPAAHRTPSQPLVLKMAEPGQIGKAAHLPSGVPTG